MNRLDTIFGQRRLPGLALAGVLLVSGCGGDDSGDGGGSANNTVAPTALAGRSYSLNDSAGAGTSVLSFSSPTEYTMQNPGVPVEDGLWTGTRDGNTWTLGLTTDPGGAKTVRMNFTTASAGSYTLSRAGQADRTGTFAQRTSGVANNPDPSTTGGDGSTATGGGGGSTTGGGGGGGSTTGSTDGGTTGSTDGSATETTDGGSGGGGGTGGSTTGATDGSNSGTTDGSTTGSTDGSTTGGGASTEYTGNAPVSLHARTMFGTRTFTSIGTSGQTHTYTFSGNTFHDSDPPEEADGTFTYSANDSRATLVLDYTAPADFANDHHQMDLVFTSRDRGTFTSTYVRGDGTTITINGDFELEPLP